jgi:hypothetical protein
VGGQEGTFEVIEEETPIEAGGIGLGHFLFGIVGILVGLGILFGVQFGLKKYRPNKVENQVSWEK